MMISPKRDHQFYEYQYSGKCKYDNVRGRGGRGGRRSIMTDRGGTGKAAKRRTTVWAATEAGGCGGLSRRMSGGG